VAAGGQRPLHTALWIAEVIGFFCNIVVQVWTGENKSVIRTEEVLQSHRARLPPAQSVASCFKMLNLEVTAKLF
jgi:hypothetical protein